MHTITLEDFAKSFGTTVEDIQDTCIELINNADFDYSTINGYEFDQLILNILKKIDEDGQIIGSHERYNIWNKGWEENYQNFVNNNYDIKELTPKFFKFNRPVRYNLKYIKPSNSRFELDCYSIYRQWLFKKYLSKYDHIYEFGCGTGFNLVALAQLYPDKKLYGLDFASSSIKLINEISKYYKYNMSGYIFDMISPNKEFKLKENSSIFTVGSIEQLAGKFEKFMEYLLEQPISLCVHIEPIIELYDENNLMDYLALKFLNKRGYTKGLLPYLKKLEEDKIIDILSVKRPFFGSLYMEGYNHIVWRPL